MSKALDLANAGDYISVNVTNKQTVTDKIEANR